MIISVFGRVENTEGKGENAVGKGENAGYRQFLFFPCFEKASFPDKSKDVNVLEFQKKRRK